VDLVVGTHANGVGADDVEADALVGRRPPGGVVVLLFERVEDLAGVRVDGLLLFRLPAVIVLLRLVGAIFEFLQVVIEVAVAAVLVEVRGDFLEVPGEEGVVLVDVRLLVGDVADPRCPLELLGAELQRGDLAGVFRHLVVPLAHREDDAGTHANDCNDDPEISLHALLEEGLGFLGTFSAQVTSSRARPAPA
jgi:hypothetical protein